jgi:hypothetical protein
MPGTGQCSGWEDGGKNTQDCLPCTGRLEGERRIHGRFLKIKPEKSVSSYREISKKGDPL